MNTPKDLLAIVFADVSGSTSLYDRLGDVKAREIISRATSLLIDIIYRHGGTLVKTIGDEVMATFPSAVQAADAVCTMQREFEQATEAGSSASESLAVRVGFHFGPVIKEAGDVFGDAVNVAARMVGLAKPAQILTTEQTVNKLPGDRQCNVRLIDRTTVKGKRGTLNIYELLHEEEPAEVTVMSTGPLVKSIRPEILLLLEYGETNFELSKAKPSATLGRGLQNDVIIANAAASRLHARVEFRRNRYVLVDQSTNGTWVTPEGEKTVYVHRDELVLKGSGVLSLGKAPENDPGVIVQFRCQERFTQG